MKGKWLKPLSSFRGKMVAFMATMLLFTTAALYLINRRLEERILHQVEEHTRALTLANDLALRSLSQGEYLFKLLSELDKEKLTVSAASTIRHILIVDTEGRVVDSTEQDDLGKKLEAAIGDLPPVSVGDVMRDADANGNRTMSLRVETDKGERRIVIVVSTNQLNRVVREASRDRLLAIGALGFGSLLIIALVSWRFTRLITELARAAQRVTAGELDFQLQVKQRDEVGALAETFNEMLAGLRNKRELEEQLQRAERSAVVGRLASGIAHEIRNPLNFINLSIDHLREKFTPAAAARAEYLHILGMLKDEINRLNRLVNDFLSYGRPSRLKLRELDVRALLEEVKELVKAQAEGQNIHLNIRRWADKETGSSGEARAEDLLQADYEQLKTCFSNLVINAIQAMPQGGTLNILLRPHERHLEIEFADTGLGIAPEAIGQIFEPYYSTKETGIGLGLPLTKKIIEDHGGEITVTSEPGQGTVFTVILPRNPALSSQAVPSSQTTLSAS
jgi:signal transduction histidine kinase